MNKVKSQAIAKPVSGLDSHLYNEASHSDNKSRMSIALVTFKTRPPPYEDCDQPKAVINSTYNHDKHSESENESDDLPLKSKQVCTLKFYLCLFQNLC